jgi:hypothetical protein
MDRQELEETVTIAIGSKRAGCVALAVALLVGAGAPLAETKPSPAPARPPGGSPPAAKYDGIDGEYRSKDKKGPDGKPQGPDLDAGKNRKAR